MMRVLIDLRWMQPGYTGGTEAMSRSILRTLIALDAGNDYHVLLPLEALYDFDLRGRKNIHLHPCDGPGYYLDRWLRYREARNPGGRAFPLHSSSLVEALKTQVDVVLCLNGEIAPDLLGLPCVVMGIDLQHEYFPQFFSTEELAARRAGIAQALAGARVMCAISEYTRQTFFDKLNARPEKISVVYPAADERFLRCPSAAEAQRTLENYGLTAGAYLYYPAATWRHKNHAALLRALALLKPKGLSPTLVCSGAAKEAHPDLLSLVDELGLTGQVRWMGYLPEQDVPAFYAGALALVFPSLFEGFGMPVLEAMACGCPVACSRVTSLPEVAGEAVLYFDPTSVEEIAARLEQLLTDAPLRRRLITLGREQVKRFSWLAAVRQIASALSIAVEAQGVRPARLPAQPRDQRLELEKRWRHARSRGLSREWFSAGWAWLIYRINRRGRARTWLAQAQTARLQKRSLKAAWLSLKALLLAPEVHFAVADFPPFRRRFLRGKLKPTSPNPNR